jgi:CubicO group peptidase (beta-lactamase class C family)
VRLALAAAFVALVAIQPDDYFPPADSAGGWRRVEDAAAARRFAGVDRERLDDAFDFVQRTSKHGGLLVARRGWLVYERYFGRAHRNANANTASVGKAFTSIAVGILIHERRDLFPDGLDQRVFTPRHLPPEAFPLSDPRKADIRLGQLLSMTGGVRGNNPGLVRGREVTLDPAGPDGWLASVDAMALGKMDGPLHTKTLWTHPGGGFSYATSSIHLASIVLRHVTGLELETYVDRKLAAPLGWERWGWGYRNQKLAHTPGGGGIAPRPTDMLRFTYLLLREGRWHSTQLVPASYVRQAGRPSPYNPHSDYSLQFHVNADGHVGGAPRDAFWKPGSGGHCIYIVPSLDLVAFKLGGRDEQYDPANTGVPLDPAFQYDGSREGWRASVDVGVDQWTETLRLVVASVAPRP